MTSNRWDESQILDTVSCHSIPKDESDGICCAIVSLRSVNLCPLPHGAGCSPLRATSRRKTAPPRNENDLRGSGLLPRKVDRNSRSPAAPQIPRPPLRRPRVPSVLVRRDHPPRLAPPVPQKPRELPPPRPIAQVLRLHPKRPRRVPRRFQQRSRLLVDGVAVPAEPVAVPLGAGSAVVQHELRRGEDRPYPRDRLRRIVSYFLEAVAAPAVQAFDPVPFGVELPGCGGEAKRTISDGRFEAHPLGSLSAQFVPIPHPF